MDSQPSTSKEAVTGSKLSENDRGKKIEDFFRKPAPVAPAKRVKQEYSIPKIKGG